MVLKKKQSLPVVVDENMNVTFSEPQVVVRSDENEGVNKLAHTSFLGNDVKSTDKSALKSYDSSASLTPFTPKIESEVGVIPAWYMFFKRAHLKKDLIRKRLEEYNQPILIQNHEYRPSAKDNDDYNKKLKNLTLKEVLLMGTLKKYDLKLDILDRLKSIKKKKHAVVTIFNDNKTTDTGVIHCYDRTFSRGGMTYIIISDKGIYDPEFRMTHFYYYANNPFPIKFEKTKIPEASADAKLLDDTIEMKVIEALANIQMAKVINLLLIIGIISFIIQIVNLLVNLRGFKII